MKKSQNKGTTRIMSTNKLSIVSVQDVCVCVWPGPEVGKIMPMHFMQL